MNTYNFKFIILAVLVFLTISCKDVSDKERQIQLAVKNQLEFHPKSRLIDIYKSFFQGAFGPGHMIKSRQAALDYLNHELKTAAEYDTVIWHETGYQQRYYRINLSVVKEGIIPIDSMLNAFVQSANEAKPPALESWKNEWNIILHSIEDMDLQLAGFDEDKIKIEKLFAENKAAAHHSKIYRELYHPHYRIVNEIYFRKLLHQIAKEKRRRIEMNTKN